MSILLVPQYLPMTDGMLQSEINVDEDSKRTSFKDREIQRGDVLAKLYSL